MSILSTFEYAKEHNIPMTSISFTPHYDEKKGRVVKGQCISQSGWNKNKRFTKKLVAIPGSTAWMIDLRQSKFYVIDIDVKNGKKAVDVLVPKCWERLQDTSNYIVETGSGGLHCYFKLPSFADDGVLTKCIKVNGVEDWFNEPNVADVDLLVGDCAVISAGSAYSFGDKLYQYRVIQGETLHDVDECSFTWEHVRSHIYKSQQEIDMIEHQQKDKASVTLEEVALHVQNIPNTTVNWDKWYRMGQLIFNVGGTFECFDEWSQHSNHYDYRSTSQLWRGMRQRETGLTVGTLLFLSKEANAERYQEIRSLFQQKGRRVISGDKHAGDLLYEELKTSLVYCNARFYNKYNNVWTSDLEALERGLRRYVMDADLWIQGQGDPSPYSQKVTHAQNCVKVIMDNAVKNRNDLWDSLAFESSRGKILFRNGYYDMRHSSFYPCSHPSFDSSIIFTEEISYDFDETIVNSQYVKSIRNRFFTLPFDEEMGSYYLLKLARATAWDREKKFLAGIGSSNTGKSAISSALKHCLGGYFGTWNGVNICYKPNSSQDEAQKLRWMYLLRSKRIIVSNELQVGGMGIDGNMIKKLANGGLDDIVAREHGGNETSFKVGFLPILFAQDLDRIRPIDDAVMTRLRAINYQRVYVDDPSNEFELKIDRGLDIEVQTPEFRMSFMTLLFQTYKQWIDDGCDESEPETVKHTVKEVVGSDTNIIDSFLNDFEITNNPEDFVRSSDIERWMTEGKFRVTMTKFGLEMNKYAKIQKLEGVESKNKKIGGKAQKCWFGIRLMTDE